MKKPRKPHKVNLEKEQFWRTVLLKFQASGLPFRTFCKQEQLSENTFQYWRKRLRERDEARGIHPLISKGENRPSQLEEKTSFWLSTIDDANIFEGSLKEFCRQRSVSSGSLYHWERRLKNEGLTAGLRKEPEQAAALVPVRVVQEDFPVAAVSNRVASDEQKVEIRLHDGNRVLLPATLPADLLIQLVNGLRGKK